MTIQDVATAFTNLLKAGDHEGAARQFNADDIVSIEAMEGPMARIQGTEAVARKSEWWYANHEVHSVETFGPYINGDQFALRFAMDLTVKETGVRESSEEIALYTVRDDKIVEERFYY